MALSWVAVNANDGQVITDLPGLRVDGGLKRTIGRHEAQTASLPLDGAPDNWRQATRTKAVFLVALDEQVSVEKAVPLWGGIVTERTTSHKDAVLLSLVTAEDYLNDRFVGDAAFEGVPQNTIVRTLVESFVAPEGIPIRVVELPGPNPVRDRTYKDHDDKSVFSALDELSGVIGGPEWTIGWEWVGSGLGLVLSVGARIGSAKPEGLGPAAQFFLPGNLTDAELVEGYRRGEGANDVMATSSSGGDTRPESPRQRVTSDLRPRVEFRWTPSSSITEIDTLTGHAQRALAGMQDGTVQLSLTARRDASPRIGLEWNLGDDIGFDLTSRAWPDGITGTARVISIEITNTEVVPVLDVTGIEGIV